MTQTLASGSGTDNDPEGSRRIVTVLISIFINVVFGNPVFPGATFYSRYRILALKAFQDFNSFHENGNSGEPKSEKAAV